MNPVYTGPLYADRLRAVPIRQRGSALRPVGHRTQSWGIRPRADWIAIGTVPALIRAIFIWMGPNTRSG
jgi:site-specific DNA recombinase